MKFSMTCSCGDKMSVEAENRQDAVAKMKAVMTQKAIDQHCAQKHPGTTLTQSEVHAQINVKLAQEA